MKENERKNMTHTKVTREMMIERWIGYYPAVQIGFLQCMHD